MWRSIDFVKFEFNGCDFIFGIFLLSMMIPYHTTVIPLFKMMAALEWLNTYQALILPNLAYPFAIFLMRQNMLAFPDSPIEAGVLTVRGSGSSSLESFFPHENQH
jgi:lactose/L-arabinose transport system permease protein